LLARRPAPDRRRRDGYSIAAADDGLHHPGGVTSTVIAAAQMNN
jgi:hypothetical protein